MQIVGHENGTLEVDHVLTIDLWFSNARKVWVVERLNGDGHPVGAIYQTPDQYEARACLEEWLRAHEETRLVCQHGRAGDRRAAGAPRRRAA